MQAGFLCAALQLLLTCSTCFSLVLSTHIAAIPPNTASPDLLIHIALLLMQKDCLFFQCGLEALEPCLTLSHAIPVFLLQPPCHMQHLLVLCTTLSLHLSPAASLPPAPRVSPLKCRPLAFILTLPSNSNLTNAFLDFDSISAEQTWICHP